jgi:hypothetical protein
MMRYSYFLMIYHLYSDDAKTNAADEGTYVWCSPSGMSVVVLDSVYDKLNIDPESTKVGSCGPILYPILGFSYYSFPLDNTCGTTSDSSATDITFRNEIKGLYQIIFMSF